MLHSSVRLIESLSVAAAVFLATAAVLGVSFVLALSYDVPISALLRDPAVTTSESGFYVGSLSNLGALLWASAAVCLTFAYMVLRTVAGDRKMKNFLLASAVLTAMLSLDDFFLLHEEVYPLIGIPEKVVYGIYLIVGVVYLARFRKTIVASTEVLFLGVALVGFGASVAVDMIPFPIYGRVYLEDICKSFAIAFWLTYFSRTSLRAVRSTLYTVTASGRQLSGTRTGPTRG